MARLLIITLGLLREAGVTSFCVWIFSVCSCVYVLCACMCACACACACVCAFVRPRNKRRNGMQNVARATESNNARPHGQHYDLNRGTAQQTPPSGGCSVKLRIRIMFVAPVQMQWKSPRCDNAADSICLSIFLNIAEIFGIARTSVDTAARKLMNSALISCVMSRHTHTCLHKHTCVHTHACMCWGSLGAVLGGLGTVLGHSWAVL